MPPLPNTNASPYPSYPNQSNPSMPMPSYPRQSMPQAPFGGGFMPQPQAYPPNAYPPSSTTVYPSHPNTSYHPNSHTYPLNQGYTGYGYQQVPPSGPSCPIVSNMTPSFSQMQGHIKDVRRSKVGWFDCFFLLFLFFSFLQNHTQLNSVQCTHSVRCHSIYLCHFQ